MATIKTTVYLDADDYYRLKLLAEREGRSAAGLVREAVSQYARKATGAASHRSIGAGRSGGNRLSERSEELLRKMGRTG